MATAVAADLSGIPDSVLTWDACDVASVDEPEDRCRRCKMIVDRGRCDRCAKNRPSSSIDSGEHTNERSTGAWAKAAGETVLSRRFDAVSPETRCAQPTRRLARHPRADEP